MTITRQARETVRRKNMDEFLSALQRLSSLHTARVQALTEQLEEEQRVRRELEEKIEALKKANDNARKSVEHAKKKIRQQAKQIRELEEKLQNNGREEHTSALCGEPSSPVVAERAAARPDCPSQAITTDTHRLNQTCATLFESPAPVDVSKVTMSEETPVRAISKSSRVREEGSLQKASGEEERERGGETMDYHRGESIETVAGDVIILDDDVTGNNYPAHAPACSSSKSAIDPPALNRERTVSATSEDLQSSLPPSGPVHMVYSHAHVYSSDVRLFEEENEQSPKKAHTTTRPLSLRDTRANKVKWREVSSSNLASMSATSSNLSDTKASQERTSSPGGGDESEGASASSSPEQSSPSLLGASNSPWKLQQSNSSSSSRQQQHTSSTSTPVNMTHSLFARTPAASHVVTTPVSMLKSVIPPSDSQFSLDVSQSAPLSPELCPMTIPTHPPPPSKAIPASSAILKPASKDTPVSSHGADCSVVPITPGVPSVSKILKGRKRWMRISDQSPASEKTAALSSHDQLTSVRKAISVGGKRGQEQVDFEDEDILPQSKVHRLASMDDTATSHTVDDDHTRLEYESVMDSSEEEEDDNPMSPVFVNTAKPTPEEAAATSRSSDTTSVTAVQGQGMANNQSIRSTPQKSGHQRILARAGLPTSYKFEAPIRKKADRDKLEGKACPDCQAWFARDDGIHGDVEDHLRRTCRHKHLYQPPDEDSRIWNISFPSTEECESIMNRS